MAGNLGLLQSSFLWYVGLTIIFWSILHHHKLGNHFYAVGGNKEAATAIGRDVAMQIAAMAPIAVDESDVPEEVIAKEKEIGRAKALEEGKPENIVDRIAEGMVKKCLPWQYR